VERSEEYKVSAFEHPNVYRLTVQSDGDTVFTFNYRSDRVREFTQLLGDFDRSPTPDFPYPKDISLTTMTQYNVKFPYPIAFPPQRMNDVLAEWLSKQGIKQCHVAETEKYAHVVREPLYHFFMHPSNLVSFL
jgi:bisphosphoglycerate-independent phosphoglycerate mutase (AlkP superfamily)